MKKNLLIISISAGIVTSTQGNFSDWSSRQASNWYNWTANKKKIGDPYETEYWFPRLAVYKKREYAHIIAGRIMLATIAAPFVIAGGIKLANAISQTWIYDKLTVKSIKQIVTDLRKLHTDSMKLLNDKIFENKIFENEKIYNDLSMGIKMHAKLIKDTITILEQATQKNTTTNNTDSIQGQADLNAAITMNKSLNDFLQKVATPTTQDSTPMLRFISRDWQFRNNIKQGLKKIITDETRLKNDIQRFLRVGNGTKEQNKQLEAFNKGVKSHINLVEKIVKS